MRILDYSAYVEFRFDYDNLKCSVEAVPYTVRFMDSIRFTPKEYDKAVDIFSSSLHWTYDREYKELLGGVIKRGETLDIYTLCSIFWYTYKGPSTTLATPAGPAGDLATPAGPAGELATPAVVEPAEHVVVKPVEHGVYVKPNWARYAFVYIYIYIPPCDE
jgi:hypothetical protein